MSTVSTVINHASTKCMCVCFYREHLEKNGIRSCKSTLVHICWRLYGVFELLPDVCIFHSTLRERQFLLYIPKFKKVSDIISDKFLDLYRSN